MNTERTVNGIKIFNYDIIDSTNLAAKEYAGGENSHFPAVFIAEEQSAGRGRRGRSFDSARGGGLYISFLFRVEKEFDAAEITLGAAVKLCRVIEELSGINPGIKWVNDIFAGNKKLAGILAEGAGVDLTYAVCGIGINLYKREFSAELSGIATTLEDECGVRVDKEIFAKRLIEEFFKPEEKAKIINEYRQRSVVIGKRVEVRKILGESCDATVIEIAEDGALIVEREGGVRERLVSAEVSIKTKTGKGDS